MGAIVAMTAFSTTSRGSTAGACTTAGAAGGVAGRCLPALSLVAALGNLTTSRGWSLGPAATITKIGRERQKMTAIGAVMPDSRTAVQAETGFFWIIMLAIRADHGFLKRIVLGFPAENSPAEWTRFGDWTPHSF